MEELGIIQVKLYIVCFMVSLLELFILKSCYIVLWLNVTRVVELIIVNCFIGEILFIVLLEILFYGYQQQGNLLQFSW